jgi:redox-sensitive bicupin YhaK (pirin superfamily)
MPNVVQHVIEPRPRDLGDFAVRRVLPAPGLQTVGPFIFFDHMGPADFGPQQGVNVRPHPHVGLATVTYLFEGAFLHRDSLGTAQVIRPGDVNWMVAGRGIAHSERTPPEVRDAAGRTRAHGIQTWVALPRAEEEREPSFAHHAAASLPRVERAGVTLTVILGTAYGRRSPVDVFSPTLYVDALLAAGAAIDVETEHEQRACYVVQGCVEIDGQRFGEGQFVVLAPGAGTVAVRAVAASRLMLAGGAPLDGLRHIYWNFVSSSRERIETAKRDWRERRFAPVPGDPERIPLPDE